MKMWRIMVMNDKDKIIVEHMIHYVEEIEKDIQAAKMGSGSKTKAVKDILKELEGQIKNENKKY